MELRITEYADELPTQRRIDYIRFVNYVRGLEKMVKKLQGLDDEEDLDLEDNLIICAYAIGTRQDHELNDYARVWFEGQIDQKDEEIKSFKSEISELKTKVRRLKRRRRKTARREGPVTAPSKNLRGEEP